MGFVHVASEALGGEQSEQNLFGGRTGALKPLMRGILGREAQRQPWV